MTNETKVTGHWWIFGHAEEPQLGSLFLNEGGIKLKIFNPVNRNEGEALIASTRERQVASTIFGRDEDNHPATLINCLISREQLGQNRDEYEIIAGICVRGQEVESLEKSLAKYVSISLNKFHRWLGGRIMLPSSKFTEDLTWTQSRGMKLDYTLTEGVSLTITQMTFHSRSVDELVFTPHCDIALTFENARSLEEIMSKWVPSVVRFFSLLYGSCFHWDSIGYSVENPFTPATDFPSEEKGWPEGGRITTHTSLKKADENSEVFLPWILAPFEKIKSSLPDMLARWFELDQRLKPVVDLFWAVAFGSSLYAEAAFLFLVQALEVYHVRSPVFDSSQLALEEHRRRVRAVTDTAPDDLKEWLRRKIQSLNYKHLNERLLEIFRHHSAEAIELFGDLEAAAKQITFTRNHLTHYSSTPEAPLLLDDQKLVIISNKLERLLWIIFLREIGLPEPSMVEAWKSLKNLRGISSD